MPILLNESVAEKKVMKKERKTFIEKKQIIEKNAKQQNRGTPSEREKQRKTKTERSKIENPAV